MDEFFEKTLACARQYTGRIINVHPVVFSEAEVEEAIRKGEIFDSKTLSAWACYRLMK